MLDNNNADMAFNNFDDVPQIPYRTFLYLLENKSETAENFWKALAYDDIDALSHKKLTLKQKRNLIWKGETQEDGFKVFNKPVISDSMLTANSSIQVRMFRYGLIPTNQYNALVLFEIDTYTNEKTASIIDENGIVMERTDYLETRLLKLLNGVDIGIGYNFLQFNKEISRTSQSLPSINNSKSFFGRVMILALQWSIPETDGECG